MGIGKLLFGVYSRKSLHCSICPNTNDQSTFFDLAVYSPSSETQGQAVGSREKAVFYFDPTDCPWVSEDVYSLRITMSGATEPR